MTDAIRPPASVLESPALQPPAHPTKRIDPSRSVTVADVMSPDGARRPKKDMDFVDTMKLLAVKLQHHNIMSEDDDVTKEIGNAIMMQMNQKAMETQRLEMLMSKLGDEHVELVFTDKNNRQITGQPSAILPGVNGMVKIVIDGETYLTQNLAGAKLVGTKIPQENGKKHSASEPESIPTPPPAPPPEYLNSTKPLMQAVAEPPESKKVSHLYSSYIS